MLAEETLKIILAVIAIGFLAYFLFSIYNTNKNAKELEFAEASLNYLMQEISSEKEEVQIYNPTKYWVCSWPNSDAGEEMPVSCLNMGWESCVCICKKDTSNKCDSKGICVDNSQDFSVPESIEIKDPPITLSINYFEKIISKK